MTQLATRGWTGPGGGAMSRMPVPTEFRGTSRQVCGLWPFAVGSGTPMIGVPLGSHLFTGSTVCFDPISWFTRAHLISNPSCFVLGLPGLGKSSTIRHVILGMEGYGAHSMILGDLKPDYVELVRSIGGQVIPIGRGRGKINPLDDGGAHEAAKQLSGQARQELLADAHGRQLTMLAALVQLSRSQPPTDREESILDACLKVLSDRLDRLPIIGDVLDVIREAPPSVREVAIDRGDINRYKEITEDLEASLMAMLAGRFGEIFSGQTSIPMRTDRSVVFDVSAIKDTDKALEAAALLTCWSYGFGVVGVQQTLADYGIVPRTHFNMVMDEMWRALRSGPGMVERADVITRLNRTVGVSTMMITHTMKDLESLASEEDRAKARGFVERAGVVLLGGLPPSEKPLLDRVMGLSESEKNLITSWDSPPGWDAETGREGAPPGRGKFLIKVGGRPGIPVQVRLTSVELAVNDTNQRWHQ